MDQRLLRVLLLVIAVSWVCGCASAPVTKPTVTAIVVTPDGKPAVGALAALVPNGHWAEITDGRTIDDDPAYQRCTAGADGGITFAGMAGPFLLVVIHPSGYARVDKQRLVDHGRVQLQAWAHVDGRFFVGGKPGVGKRIVVSRSDENIDNPELPHAEGISDLLTDSQGRFTVDRIPPGNIQVSHEYALSFHGRRYAEGGAEQRNVTVGPGQTVTVTFGDTGRPIVGAVTIPVELAKRKDWEFTDAAVSLQIDKPSMPMPVDVKNGSLDVQQKWYHEFIQTQAGKKYLASQTNQMSSRQNYLMDISPDGAFRVEDVPAGSYSLYIEARVPSNDPAAKQGMVIAFAESKFVVPEIPGGRSDEAMRIPDVALKMYQHVIVPNIGDIATDFSVQTLDGKPLKLTDFRGRFVLLEFWATWCNPCRGEVPDLKNMYDHYGKEGRLAMISLSIDDLPYAPKQFAEEHGIAWLQGFVGPDGKAVNDYGVDQYGVPSMWLIGPDGKVIARPMPGEDTVELWEKISSVVSTSLGTGR